MTPEQARNEGLIPRAVAIKTMRVSESTFNRLGLKPAARIGRVAYYDFGELAIVVTARAVMRENPVLQQLHRYDPDAAQAAARCIANRSMTE